MQTFQQAKSGIYKEVWEKKINVSSENLYIGATQYEGVLPALKRVRQENFVYIDDSVYAYGVLIKSGICDITISKDRFYKTTFAMPANKGFPYMDMFNSG